MSYGKHRGPFGGIDGDDPPLTYEQLMQWIKS